jgi:hypothetical protein
MLRRTEQMHRAGEMLLARCTPDEFVAEMIPQTNKLKTIEKPKWSEEGLRRANGALKSGNPIK